MTNSATNLSLAGLNPLQQLIEMGGPVMWVLLSLAVAGLVTFFYLLITGALFSPRLTASLRRVISEWQKQPSRDIARKLSHGRGWLSRANPLATMLATAMEGRIHGTGESALREDLARRSQQAIKPFEAPLKILEVIAALAPLLGLLGTVMGMMAAFNAMAASEGQANATELSGGIYEALVTTAAGLVVAIPFAAIAAWVEFRLRRINLTINDSLVRVLNAPVPTDVSPGSSAPETTAFSEPDKDHAEPAYATG